MTLLIFLLAAVAASGFTLGVVAEGAEETEFEEDAAGISVAYSKAEEQARNLPIL